MTEKRFRISQGYNDKFCHDWEKNKLLNFRQTVDLLNELAEEIMELDIQNDFLKDENRHMRDLVNENRQLKKELKRYKDWINSDKYDYELTLSFIKNKGYSLKDVLEYKKELSE